MILVFKLKIYFIIHFRSLEHAPEGFLEYGPPGFEEYGPPKEDELARETTEVYDIFFILHMQLGK